jgi:hypothetical protein
METILALLATIAILLLLIAKPFIQGAYSTKLPEKTSEYVSNGWIARKAPGITKNWKFDPHEEKILHQLLSNPQLGISVKDLNSLLNLGGKSAENQRQRRHLVIKELNTKLFVLFNVRECVVRIPESFDSRKKQYIILITDEIYQELSTYLNA